MTSPHAKIRASFDQPILFRTTNAEVYKTTLMTGSLWLRSDEYYRQVDDRIRRDESEGVNESKITVPLRIHPENGSSIEISGPGRIGQRIQPHYILSLHGSSISEGQLRSFGGCTFGIKNISKLSAEVLYRASLILNCAGYRFGPVSYRYATLALSHSHNGSSAICIGGAPPVYLNPWNTDVLTKQPIRPLTEQDEWRIVIFTDGYLKDNVDTPLQIKVDLSHFYAYQPFETDS